MNQMKKVAILLDDLSPDARYPIRRSLTLIEQLAQTVEVSVILPRQYASFFSTSSATLHVLEQGLVPTLQAIEPDLLLCEQGFTKKDVSQQLHSFIPSIIYLDHLGEGTHEQDRILQSLDQNTHEQDTRENDQFGTHLFVLDQQLQKIIAEKQASVRDTMPLHLVIVFSDQDPSRLTYRMLRHLIHLQIPLRMTIVVGKQYAHDITELKMMALQRNQTKVIQTDHYLSVMKTAQIVLCSAKYFPYEVAALGIPCIVVAEHDTEMNLSFPMEQHGFLHLGLGRKVKQSMLLNAIMEFVLHEGLRNRMVERQLALTFQGTDIIVKAIHHALQQPSHPKNNPLEIEAPNML